MSAIYDLTLRTAKGDNLNLGDFRGKVLLIVNTATRCGLTPQYEQLQALHAKYSEQGLVILDFPCNQFREQAPESIDEYAQICQMKFGTQFTIFDKIDVNGDQAHPLYVYLKQQQPNEKSSSKFKDLLIKLASLGETRGESDIKWNFTKFLVSRNGDVVARFAPSTTPFEMEDEIVSLLA